MSTFKERNLAPALTSPLLCLDHTQRQRYLLPGRIAVDQVLSMKKGWNGDKRRSLTRAVRNGSGQMNGRNDVDDFTRSWSFHHPRVAGLYMYRLGHGMSFTQRGRFLLNIENDTPEWGFKT